MNRLRIPRCTLCQEDVICKFFSKMVLQYLFQVLLVVWRNDVHCHGHRHRNVQVEVSYRLA